MKKIVYIITSIALFFTNPAFGQDDTGDAQEEEAVMTPPKQPKQSDFQNWLFAGASLVAAVGAVLLVAWNPGSPPPPGQATLPN